ncbi:DUF3422 family protein [Sphingobium chungangianum]
MREHDLRKRVVEEMHLRRWPRLSAPMEIVQILNILDEGDRARERDFVAQFSGNPACLTGASHVSGTLHSGIAYTWERHSEASTVTLFYRLRPVGIGVPRCFENGKIAGRRDTRNQDQDRRRRGECSGTLGGYGVRRR